VDDHHASPKHPPRRVKLGSISISIPRSRFLRITLGVLLIIGGFLGFLPILGFWMIPLGLLVLSHDFAPVRRLRRRIEVWWARRRRKKKSA
jgi:hypothetical protein